MPAFKPANDDHAVVSVAFVLTLNKRLPTRVLARLSSPEERASLPWLQGLPAFLQTNDLVVATVEGDRLAASQSPVVQFAFLRPNGQATWSLRIGGTEISVEASQYTRWARIAASAKEYLKGAMSYLARGASDLAATAVSLNVLDRFVGAPAGYDVAELIRDRRTVGKIPFEAGNVWHTHLGWFEIQNWGRILNHLNIQATGTVRPDGPPNSEPVAPFQVDFLHRQQGFFANPLKPDLLGLDDYLEFMHERNKNALIDLLTDTQLQSIGLKGTLQ